MTFCLRKEKVVGPTTVIQVTIHGLYSYRRITIVTVLIVSVVPERDLRQSHIKLGVCARLPHVEESKRSESCKEKSSDLFWTVKNGLEEYETPGSLW